MLLNHLRVTVLFRAALTTSGRRRSNGIRYQERTAPMSLARSAGLAGGLLVVILSVSQADDTPRWIKVEIGKDAARAALKEAAPSPEVQAKDDEGKEYVLIRADDEAVRGLLERGFNVSNATQADFV